MSQSTRAGSLTRYVQVQRKTVGRAADGSGDAAETWATIKSVYAGIEALSSRELTLNGGLQSEVTHRITMRYDADIWSDPRVGATLRIVYAGRYFNLRPNMNVDEGNAIIEMLAAEGMSGG